jgi:hypothetical protein
MILFAIVYFIAFVSAGPSKCGTYLSSCQNCMANATEGCVVCQRDGLMQVRRCLVLLPIGIVCCVSLVLGLETSLVFA